MRGRGGGADMAYVAINWDACKRWLMDIHPQFCSLLEEEWGGRDEWEWSCDQKDFPPRLVLDVSVVKPLDELLDDEPRTRYPSAEERSAILASVYAAAQKWGLRLTEVKTNLKAGPGRMQWVLKPRYQAWQRG